MYICVIEYIAKGSNRNNVQHIGMRKFHVIQLDIKKGVNSKPNYRR